MSKEINELKVYTICDFYEDRIIGSRVAKTFEEAGETGFDVLCGHDLEDLEDMVAQLKNYMRNHTDSRLVEGDYKAGFKLLMEYWDSLPDADKPEIHRKLEELGL